MVLGDYMTTGEVAELLGVSTTRVRQLVTGGQLPGCQKWGRWWIIPSQSVRIWARDRRRAGRPRGSGEGALRRRYGAIQGFPGGDPYSHTPTPTPP
jgi:excisionase family DNA binding protein